MALMSSRPARLRRVALLFLVSLLPAFAQTLRFGAIGDSGTGGPGQLRVASQMEALHRNRPWELVLMLGDNVYEDGDPRYFDRKYKKVYGNLMSSGVKFHATLGNHDRVSPRARKGMAQVEDDAFGFVGRRDEYVLAAGPTVDGKVLARFICLNSSAWMEELNSYERIEPRLTRLRGWLHTSDQFHWNIVFFHNPIYSFTVSRTLGRLVGRYGHGPEANLRRMLEPELVGRVDVVLSGHEHFYQKIRPQHGVHYFISGGAGKLRRGAAKRHPEVEFAAEVLHFMDFEVSPTELKYSAISDKGVQIHSGAIPKQRPALPTTAGRTQPSALNPGKRLLYDRN